MEVGVSGLDVAVSGLEVDVSGLEVAVSGLEVAVSGLEVAVSGLEVDVSGLEVAVSGLEVDITGRASPLSFRVQNGVILGGLGTIDRVVTDITNRPNGVIWAVSERRLPDPETATSNAETATSSPCIVDFQSEH